MAKLERKLRRYRRLVRVFYVILLVLIPIQSWQVLAQFSWVRLALLLSSVLALGSAFWILLTLRQVEEKLSERGN